MYVLVRECKTCVEGDVCKAYVGGDEKRPVDERSKKSDASEACFPKKCFCPPE